MEYFIRGTAHFFNLFAEFFEHCENVVYFIFVILFFILIIWNFSKIKNSLKDIIKSYARLFKFFIFLLAFVLLLITSILTYKCNNQFKVLSLIVAIINFFKETFNLFDNKVLHDDKLKIFTFKDWKNILISTLVLVCFKITYWAELYVFDIDEIKKYFIAMFIVVCIQIFIVLFFKLYTIYEKVFFLVINSKEYTRIKRIKNFIEVLKIAKNDINCFRVIRIYFQKEKITTQTYKEIHALCLYYIAIKCKVKFENNFEYNLKIYEDFRDLQKRLGCENIE